MGKLSLYVKILTAAECYYFTIRLRKSVVVRSQKDFKTATLNTNYLVRIDGVDQSNN
jgi:hypothetical protein